MSSPGTHQRSCAAGVRHWDGAPLAQQADQLIIDAQLQTGRGWEALQLEPPAHPLREAGACTRQQLGYRAFLETPCANPCSFQSPLGASPACSRLHALHIHSVYQELIAGLRQICQRGLAAAGQDGTKVAGNMHQNGKLQSMCRV